MPRRDSDPTCSVNAGCQPPPTPQHPLQPFPRLWDHQHESWDALWQGRSQIPQGERSFASCDMWSPVWANERRNQSRLSRTRVNNKQVTKQKWLSLSVEHFLSEKRAHKYLVMCKAIWTKALFVAYEKKRITTAEKQQLDSPVTILFSPKRDYLLSYNKLIFYFKH